MANAASTTSGVAQQNTLENILQQLLYRNTFGLPTCNSCEDINTHMNKLDAYFKACAVTSEGVKTTILLNSLTDDMQMELCGQLEFQKNENNYKWLSEKLLELYQPKETELSPYVKLFSHKQTVGQNTREFLGEIRREGYRLLKNLDPEEREKR